MANVINAEANRRLERHADTLSFYRTSQQDTLGKCWDKARDYNIGSVLRGEPGDYELGVSAELCKQFGATNGVKVPLSILSRADLAVGSGTAGVNLVDADYVFRSLVPVLRNRSVIA